jgi:hypothetical protein
LRAAIAAYDKASQQADQALKQIADDDHEYDKHRTAARGSVYAAQAAMRKAEQAVRDRDAGGAGQHALQRARTTLPTLPTSDVPKQALTRLRKQAEEAQRHAEQAERQARQKINAAQSQRRRQDTSTSFDWPSSEVSSRRPSSRGTSRRPSSRGTSRRPSSRGGSRRGSSRGSSRRR